MEFTVIDLEQAHLSYVREQLALHAEGGRLLGRLLEALDFEAGRLWAIVPTERLALAIGDLESDPIRGDAEQASLMAETVRRLRPLLDREPRRLLTIEYWMGVDHLEPGPGHSFLVGDSAFDYVTSSDPDELIAHILSVSLWFPTVGVLATVPTDVSLPGTRDLAVEHVERIVEGLDLLLVGAWDADGYVFWEPPQRAVGKRLTLEERALLDEVVASRDPALRSLAADMLGGRILTIPEANELRDAVGDELVNTGVDAEKGEVNERGVRLDDLIDRIARLSEFHDS